MVKKIVSTLLFVPIFIFTLCLSSQAQKKWTTPVLVTEMNGGKIYVSYCTNPGDSIHYRIQSKCSGLKNIYTCFAFKYLDSNSMEQTYVVRDISLAGTFDKKYSIPAEKGFRKISQPYLPETIVAYVNDESDQTDIRNN